MREAHPRSVMAVVCGVLCFCALRTAAVPQSKSGTAPSHAATLLSSATSRTNIESPSSAPFVLRATARYTVRKQSVEGTYALGWAAPNLYREDLVYGQDHETIIVANGKRYHAPDSGTPRENLWSQMIQRAMRWSLPPGARAKERVQGEHYGSGAQLTCIVADHDDTHERICVDPNNYEPFSYDLSGPSGKQAWTFAEYTSLANAPSGSQRFPALITYRDSNGVSAEIDIQSIAAVSGFAANEFTPPPGAVEQDLTVRTP